MGVRVVKTEPKCRACTHPKRDKVDELLEKRSNRQTTPESFEAALVALDAGDLKADSLKNHWRKHCEVISEEEAAATEAITAAITEGLKEKLSRGETVSPDDVLDAILAGGMAELEWKLEHDGKLGITVDHLLKAVGEKTKRKQNESQQKLLDALGGGIGMVFEKALGTPAKLPAIEAEVIEDAEVTEVPE